MVTEKAMQKMVWFDMDGTIADLYGVENWLTLLQAEDTTPYVEAGTLVNMSQLAKLLHKLQKNGYLIGILSWTSKHGSEDYNKRVTQAKQRWLKRHLPSVLWDNIKIVDYGIPKQNFCMDNNDILFDDEAHNRNNWTGVAYDVKEIITVLKALTT